MQSFRPSLAISALLHATILLWGLIWFTPKPLDLPRVETMAIDLVPISEFSQNKLGTSKGKPTPDKFSDAKADPKELTDLVKKVSEKDPIKAATPPPPAEEKKPEEKAEDKPAAKPEPKPEPKETLKTPEPPKKPEPPKEQPKAAAQTMKAAPTKREFDPNKIEALLNRQEAQRQRVTDLNNSPMPTMGILNGQAALLSQTEIDALRQRLKQCWNPPAGAADAGKLYVMMRVALRRDGSVASSPELVAGSPSVLGPAMAESARRAILTCQPFTMLKPEHYDQWNVMDLKFDPSDM
jgi:outer membrane biosynthesis protein TonB